MKLGNIETLYNTLSSLKEKEMPIRLSYKFTLLLDKIDCDYNFFISEIRKIINKYGLKDEHGELVQENGNIKINPDSLSLAEKALEDLHETEIKLPNVTLTLDELESLNIKPADLRALLPFIKETD